MNKQDKAVIESYSYINADFQNDGVLSVPVSDLRHLLDLAKRGAAMGDEGMVESALRELIEKLDECAPQIANLSTMQFVRSGTRYTGPSYGEALAAARAAIAAMQGEN